MLWAATIGGVIALLALDFVVTRRPHDVSMREAVGWSIFYVALPLAFGAYVRAEFGSTRGVEYLTGYLVGKSLSVDRSEEHTSELQSLMRISYAVFCLKTKKKKYKNIT